MSSDESGLEDVLPFSELPTSPDNTPGEAPSAEAPRAEGRGRAGSPAVDRVALGHRGRCESANAKRTVEPNGSKVKGGSKGSRHGAPAFGRANSWV